MFLRRGNRSEVDGLTGDVGTQVIAESAVSPDHGASSLDGPSPASRMTTSQSYTQSLLNKISQTGQVFIRRPVDSNAGSNQEGSHQGAHEVGRNDRTDERSSLLLRGTTHSKRRWHEREPQWLYTRLWMIWLIMCSNYANIFLILIPIGYVGRIAHWPAEAVLVFSGLSMLPLTQLVALSTEELGARLGDAVADILSYSFGNAGTIIISCILLRRNETLVVQTSLLGAMVFNLLVVMGCLYLAGGINRMEQAFNATMAQVNGSVLILAIGTITLPAILRQVQGEESVAIVSRQLAITSIVIYFSLLLFQFWSHRRLFELSQASSHSLEQDDELSLPPLAALSLLTLSTAALTAATEFFVDTLDAVTARHGISRTFIGFIFLPLVSNALAHFAEVGDAFRDKMDKAATVAIGCTVQIALFIIPLSVLVGWAIGTDMSLRFDVFLNASAFLAILLLNSVTQNGKSNFLEGLLLLNCYLGIAVAAFFYPAGAGDGEKPIHLAAP